MRALITLFLLLASLAPASAQHLAIRLVPESAHPRAGAPLTIALDTRPAPGWHGYWENPGDAGFPATLAWTLPGGVTAGAPAYPVPEQLVIGGLMNFVFERPYAPLVDLRIPAGLAAGTTLPIRLHASYLVCTASLCVPEAQDLSLALTIGDGAPADRAAFDRWRRAIPKPLGSAATWQPDAGRIAIPYPASAPLAEAYFFPLTAGALDYAAPQTVARDGDRLIVASKGAGAKGAMDGVLRIAPGQGLLVHAALGVVPPPPAPAPWRDAGLAFALAVLGGLVLNVMPCVFPILSLKALQLARSGTGAAHARGEALAYTAGVVLVVTALGALILGLRAGGTQVGWAFQLQNPRVILLLFLLTAAIGLNLIGLFELPTPRLGRLSESGGAFATGALAAIVATPCTGPFMGAALGAALVLPWFAALAVFAGLGLGLALPFLLIGFIPALRRRLPRPGAWMATLRHVLAVPMLLTAAALAWVLWEEAGAEGFWAAIAAVFTMGCLLLAFGRDQRRGDRSLYGPMAAAIAVVAVVTPGVLPRSTARAAAVGAQAFTEPRLAALRAQRRPVFAYFTADWCLTCKVNEKGAIETSGVHDAFRRANVAVLEGDWTNGDPALGRFIEAHNRAGVPLYLYYAPGAAEPRVLPQLLTPGMLEGLAS